MIDLNKYIWLTTMMVLATKDESWNPYTSNVYFRCDESYKFYFISKDFREHSKHIIENWIVAWSILNTEKYNETDQDKKWLQFRWNAKVLKNNEGEKIIKNIFNLDKKYSKMIEEWHYIFECTPEKVKIWDEEIYGGNGKKFEFEF